MTLNLPRFNNFGIYYIKYYKQGVFSEWWRDLNANLRRFSLSWLEAPVLFVPTYRCSVPSHRDATAVT